jgi:hypothetical protein
MDETVSERGGLGSVRKDTLQIGVPTATVGSVTWEKPGSVSAGYCTPLRSRQQVEALGTGRRATPRRPRDEPLRTVEGHDAILLTVYTFLL